MLESHPTTEALNTLREKLRDMFHFSHNDLDFGIFRILKIKRDEVNQFIDKKLTTIVDEALTDVADALYDSQLAKVKEFVNEEGEGMTLDFFAGSGTTGHAILSLNKADNGNRKFILVEMGDYFDSTLKERIRRVMFSQNWKAGKPDPKKEINGTVGIAKYQRLEQYEDILNNITITPHFTNNKHYAPHNIHIPVKYLYRPEEQQIRLMMDLRAPFSNRITYGKDSSQDNVDILETYCYLKGLPIQRRLRFDFGDQVYRVVRSGMRVVIFRNVTDGMDDTPQLLEILRDERLAGITHLDVNYDANQRELLGNSGLRQVHFITTSDFDSGTVWDTAEV